MASIRLRYLLEFTLCTWFFLLAAWQVAGPVPTGLPDNGDFAKVLSAMKIGPAPGTEQALANRYFSPNYSIDQRFLWDAELPTSEFWIAKAAKRYAKWFLPAGTFDLRILGILHTLIVGLALWLMLRSLRRETFTVELCAGLLLVFIFSDIEYVQFFSTPYADAAAIAFFCLFVGAALNVWRQGPRVTLFWMAAFAASGCLFLTSKLQHQLDVVPFVALAGIIAIRSNSKRVRFYCILPTLAFIAATIFMSTHTRRDYRADPIYAMVFTRLAGHSAQPEQILREFGIPASYLPYVGTLPFQKGYLLDDPAQRDFFVNTVTLRTIAGFYLHHPATAIHWLVNDLHEFAPDVNLKGWGVHRFRIADFDRHQNDTRFTWWSSLRGGIQARFWLFVPLLYFATLACCSAAAFVPKWALLLPNWPVVATISVVGALTFIVASLNDCIETARHIIVFQTSTDLIVALLLIDMASYLIARRTSRRVHKDSLVPVASAELP